MTTTMTLSELESAEERDLGTSDWEYDYWNIANWNRKA